MVRPHPEALGVVPKLNSAGRLVRRHGAELLEAYREAALAVLDEARPPDRALRLDATPLHAVGGAVLPGLLDESRAAAAELVGAPTETVVLVPNATVAFNTVLQNMEWDPDGRDEILTFSTLYGGCGKTVDYAVDSHEGRVANRDIRLEYPCEGDAVLAAFAAAVGSGSRWAGC